MLGLRTSDIKNTAIFFSFSTRLLSYGKLVYMYHLVAECCFRAGALEAFNNYFLVSVPENLKRIQGLQNLLDISKNYQKYVKTKTYFKRIAEFALTKTPL